jgi:hypothetical protein
MLERPSNTRFPNLLLMIHTGTNIAVFNGRRSRLWALSKGTPHSSDSPEEWFSPEIDLISLLAVDLLTSRYDVNDLISSIWEGRLQLGNSREIFHLLCSIARGYRSECQSLLSYFQHQILFNTVVQFSSVTRSRNKLTYSEQEAASSHRPPRLHPLTKPPLCEASTAQAYDDTADVSLLAEKLLF